MIIYIIKNIINDKVYIGQTINSIDKRWKHHIYRSNRKNDTALCRAINKYGSDKFYVEKLAEALSKEELNLLEIKFIEQYNCIAPFGYNSTTGGLGGTLSPDALAKMIKSRTGQKLSIKHKEKLSRALLNKSKTKEHSINIAIAKSKPIIDQYGRVFSSVKEAGLILNLFPQNISKVLKGKRKSTGGFVFKYQEINGELK